MNISFIYQYPLWLDGIIFVEILLAGLEIGFRLGFLQRKKLKDGDAGGGAIVISSMFALLGLILAFTYGASVSRHEARKQTIINEANALGTAFLIASLAPALESTDLRNKLLDYAHTRNIKRNKHYNSKEKRQILKQSLQKQALLWPATNRIVKSSQTPDFIKLSLVNAITNVLDIHTERLAVITDKLPGPVLWILVFLSAASLGVASYSAGVSGRMSRWRMSIFSFVLAGIILVIVDFDRASEGLIMVPNSSMKAAIRGMEADMASDNHLRTKVFN